MGGVCIDYTVAYSPYKPEGWGYYDVMGGVCIDYTVAYSPYKPDGWGLLQCCGQSLHRLYTVAYSPHKPEGRGYYDVMGRVCIDYILLPTHPTSLKGGAITMLWVESA